MSEANVLCEVRGAVALVTLNRPQSLNSFTRQMHRDLWAVLDGIADDRTVRAAVLTGAGRGFCAGADLSEFDFEPGPDLVLARAQTTLDLKHVPGGTPLPPYVSLLHDVLTGDRSLFTTSDGLARAWAAFAPLQERPPRVFPYKPGSWGPAEANALAEPDGWLLGQSAADA